LEAWHEVSAVPTRNPPQSKFCFDAARDWRLRARTVAELPVGVKFCNQCGQPAGDVTPAPLRFASPDSYTPSTSSTGS